MSASLSFQQLSGDAGSACLPYPSPGITKSVVHEAGIPEIPVLSFEQFRPYLNWIPESARISPTAVEIIDSDDFSTTGYFTVPVTWLTASMADQARWLSTIAQATIAIAFGYRHHQNTGSRRVGRLKHFESVISRGHGSLPEQHSLRVKIIPLSAAVREISYRVEIAPGPEEDCPPFCVFERMTAQVSL